MLALTSRKEADLFSLSSASKQFCYPSVARQYGSSILLTIIYTVLVSLSQMAHNGPEGLQYAPRVGAPLQCAHTPTVSRSGIKSSTKKFL